MWKISATRWVNPRTIAYVIDTPATDTLTVYFAYPDHYEDYHGADRERLWFLLDTSRTDRESLT